MNQKSNAMIDGVKSYQVILNIGILDAINKYGLWITHIRDEIYTLRGSLHKFKNKGEHNADDFKMSDLMNVFNTLYQEMGLNPDITPLNGFEFGINVKLTTNPNNVLDRLILYKSDSGINKKNYREFEFGNYSFKIYNKSEQTKVEQYQSENILRVEIKVRKMVYIKKYGLNCRVLSDLLSVEVWKRLEIVLIQMITDCLFVDFTVQEIERLSKNEYIQYLKYVNPSYWVNLQKKDRKKYSQERERCKKFLTLHGASTLQTDIIKLIREKCTELRDESQINIKKWDKLTVFQRETNPPKWDKLTIKIKSENVASQIDKVQRCKSCGRILSNPHKGQLYCSAKDVGYNQAHKCRNIDSNPRNNTKNAIRRILSVPLLFDLSDTIDPKKRRYI